MNLAHEVREIGGIRLSKPVGNPRKTDLLHLIDHPTMVGQLDNDQIAGAVEVVKIEKPIYLVPTFLSITKSSKGQSRNY
jgi:glutamate synthase (NADPH/NADH) large chain